jgi:hypothetical protein
MDGSIEDAINKNEISSDQVKKEEYAWQFDRYSLYASALSWSDAESYFKKSLTSEELKRIKISYTREEYADLEEHDRDRVYKNIIVKYIPQV